LADVLRAMLAATVVAFVALIVAARSEASRYVAYGVQDDAWLLGGPGTLDERLTKLEELGVDLVRVNLRWNQIGARRPARPTSHLDPAYRWTAADVVLEGLREHGIRPVVTLIGSPRWANGGRAPSWAPRSSQAFGDFAYAASTRYRFVREWVIWNEPNQDWQLRPTSPRTYVDQLLNPAYAALKRADAADRVGGGATAPRGDVSPLAWIRGMRAYGARFDAYAHNPHPLRPRTEAPLAAVDSIAREVTRLFGVRKRIWLTEFGYQTNPPDRMLGISPAQQAQFIGVAAHRAYLTPRVDMLIHFLVRDELDVGRWQSGLYDITDKPKLAAAAFSLPLAQTNRSGGSATLWGQVRSGTGRQRYRLRIRVGDRWVWGALRFTDARGFFTARVAAPRGSWVQLHADGAYGVALRLR
jgi:hypothetical protein